LKATFAQIKGQKKLLFKKPVTGDGMKNSQKGMVKVFKNTEGNLTFTDEHSEQMDDAMVRVFMDGNPYNFESFKKIRARLHPKEE
jgi:nicotinamide phosphoribosyltransferase